VEDQAWRIKLRELKAQELVRLANQAFWGDAPFDIKQTFTFDQRF